LLTTDITHFYHDIDTTNTVNGKPIYYLVEQEDMTLDGAIYDFGFLGLISCNNITAKNADVCGILMVNTTNSTISNVNSHDGGTHGIYIWMASDNSIINCNSYNNAGRGIFLDSSSYNNIITNCDVYNNSGHGIYLKTSSNNIITNCDIYNTQGAYLDSSSNCTFANCRVIDNSGTYGFYAISSDFTSIIGGNYSHNGIDAEGADGYNIYFENSQYITIDGVIVDEPVQGPKAEPSCPFIYSWDGTDYVFDSESLVWTGCWWWEGDTNARLPSLRLADDDTYKIKVTEELPEITYYDKIQLVAVDHPDNTEE